jgi:hypothetical protein
LSFTAVHWGRLKDLGMAPRTPLSAVTIAEHFVVLAPSIDFQIVSTRTPSKERSYGGEEGPHYNACIQSNLSFSSDQLAFTILLCISSPIKKPPLPNPKPRKVNQPNFIYTRGPLPPLIIILHFSSAESTQYFPTRTFSKRNAIICVTLNQPHMLDPPLTRNEIESTQELDILGHHSLISHMGPSYHQLMKVTRKLEQQQEKKHD